MTTSNCVQAGATLRATLFLFILCIFSVTSVHGQSGKNPETATTGSAVSVSQGTDSAAAVSQAAGADAALRGLAEKNALTVRALVGYGRIPATDMAPLAGLRAKGIDVLGATPEQLGAIIEKHGATLSTQERDSLGRVAEAMRAAGAAEAVADNAPQEAATDVMESAPGDDEALEAELAAILAEEVTEVPAPEDDSAAGPDSAAVQAAGVPFTASNFEPAALPPMKSAPFLDINALTPTQWDGAVAAAMEGMRMVYGPMSEAEEESFRKTWGVLRQYPSPDAVDYLNKFNPLLGEFLSLRGAVAEAGARLEEAMEQIAWASEADDPALAMEGVALARQHRNTVLSCQKRLDEVIAELVALGNPPDGRTLMTEGQQRYKGAKDFLKALVEQPGPEGEWVGYIIHPNNYVGKSGGSIMHQPYHFLIYSYGKPGTYYCIALDTGTYDEKEYGYVEPVDLSSIDILSGLEGDTINFTYTDEDGEPWVLHAQRYTGGAFPEFSEISPDLFEEARIKNDRILAERLEAAKLIEDPEAQLKETIGAGIGHEMNDSTIKDTLAHYRTQDAFHAAAVKWAAMGDKLADSEEARLRQFDALVAGGAPQQVAEAPVPKQPPQAEKKEEEKPEEAQEPVAEIDPEDTPLYIVDDQPAEERRVIDQEAIEFHSANVESIQRNMEKDVAEIAKETDPVRRHDLEMRVLHARANIQAEQDRIESLKTGVIVHTRSAWDDYARSQFIQNIAADQRKMEKVDRAMKKALSMADTLPYDKAAKVREIVSKGFSPEVMTATDTAKASEVIKDVYAVTTEHWEGEKKKADADAEWADTCLQTAETTKSYADKSLFVLSFAGGPAVNRVYQGAIGYIEGGPKEAFLRVGGSYNQLTGVAVDAYRGFEAAVENGGGWEEGFKGAGWEVAKGIAMDKAMGFVARGVSRGYGAVKGLKSARADVPDAPKTSGKVEAPDGQGTPSLGKIKPSGIPDDGFNRPLTELELKGYKAGIVEGRKRVNSYKSTFKKLQTARKEKAPPSEIKKILRELDERSAMIHSSPQAKMIMKSHQRNPKNREMVKRFVNSMDRVHNRVEKTFHQKMSAEWNPEDLTSIRNAGQGKTVNTDFDIARQVKFDANGLPIAPKKNGRPVPESLWQAEAQKKWEESYKEVTGQNPQRSWETVTTGGHSEAYKDLAIIERNGILRANKAWAGQTADVNQFKGDHLRRKDQPFTRIEKHVEISRSTAKEYHRRLKPLLAEKVPPKTDKANYEAFMKHKNYWEKMNEVLEGMGSGRIDPLEADRRIRLLSGGKSSLEVTHDLRNFLESLIKFGKS